MAGSMATRFHYYDRKAVSRGGGWGGAGVAPHGWTTRFTYTCPAQKLAIIEHCAVEWVRFTVATASGYIYNVAGIVPSGGVLQAMARTHGLGPAAGDIRYSVVSPHVLMTAGDEFRIQTADLSTGGTVNYEGWVEIREFDP